MFGKSIDLFDIKDCIALHERNDVFNGLAFVVGFGLGEAIGKDDKGTVLALGGLRAELSAP